RLAEALAADLARRRARTEGRRARSLHARVHVRLVVVADEEEPVPALERAGERLQPDVVGAAVARERDDRHLRVGRKRVSTPQRALRAVDAGCDRRGILERDVEPGNVPRRGREPRRRDLEATRGVHHDRRAIDRVQHRANDERDATSLAERVAAAERRYPPLVPRECLEAAHGSPLSPTYAGAPPAKSWQTSTGWMSRPPRPYTWCSSSTPLP